MELIFSRHPLLSNIHAHSMIECVNNYLETATHLNIATGFISNESIAELNRLVEFRENTLNLSLFIGMNYLEGFTRLQYNAIKDLGNLLRNNGLGDVFVSPRAKFHGKMYSFLRNDVCLGSFLGSSNLGSFIGTSQNLIESDIFFEGQEGIDVNNKIKTVTNSLGISISSANEITEFIEPPSNLLDGFEHVKKLSVEDKQRMLSQSSSNVVRVPLKTEPKSNLNTYFGAGKIKGRFSRRDYYEVELILSKNLENIDMLPDKDAGPFKVITTDGYEFECTRQGDYSKNLRSAHDLKILGKWIKGQMENAGVLKIGEPVTVQTMCSFGKSDLVLRQSIDKSYWILSLE